MKPSTTPSNLKEEQDNHDDDSDNTTKDRSIPPYISRDITTEKVEYHSNNTNNGTQRRRRSHRSPLISTLDDDTGSRPSMHHLARRRFPATSISKKVRICGVTAANSSTTTTTMKKKKRWTNTGGTRVMLIRRKLCIRYIVALVIGLSILWRYYVVLTTHFFDIRWNHRKVHDENGHRQGLGLNDISTQKDTKAAIIAAVLARTNSRKERTRPPPPPLRSSTNITDEKVFQDYTRHISSYDLSFLQDTTTTIPPPAHPNKKKSRTPCGHNAQVASKLHPSSYPDEHTLDSKSEVLITGVLNRIGFHLALRLAEECGVRVLIGVDPMFPNTKSHTARLLDRIAILHRPPSGPLKTRFIRPYVGINPSTTSTKKEGQGTHVDLELDYSKLKPTHVVHLLSSDPHAYRDLEGDDGGIASAADRASVGASPYVGEGGRVTSVAFPMRQSLVGLEHLLKTFEGGGEVPRQHFTFVGDHGVSSFDADDDSSGDGVEGDGDREEEKHRKFHTATKAMEEVLFQTYARMGNATYVGLRFPTTVYGPWGRRGSMDYDLAEVAVRHWRNSSILRDGKHSGNGTSRSRLLTLTDRDGSGGWRSGKKRDILFVDDAVDAIVTTMQYRGIKSKNAPIINVSSGEKASASSFADIIEGYMPILSNITHHSNVNTSSKMDTFTKNYSVGIDNDAMEYLHWRPKTTLRDGVQKLLVWHLNERLPYGSQPLLHGSNQSSISVGTDTNETGFQFLQRQDVSSSHNSSIPSHNIRVWGRPILPCASECVDVSHCRPSAFDKIVELSKATTKSCDIVLYTDLLGKNIDIGGKIVTAPMASTTDSNLNSSSSIICNVAFVPRSSKLVGNLVGDMTYESMLKIGIDVSHLKKDDMDIDHKLDLLNGNLVYQGWVLHFVDTGAQFIYPDERSLLKLSPGRFFHPSVKLAMYLSRDFPINPTLNDVHFTTSLMDRHTAREGEGQKVHQHFTDPNDGRKLTYTVGQGQRHAVLLLPGFKGTVQNGLLDVPSHKIRLHRAIESMMEGLPKDIKTSVSEQRRFIESANANFNRLELGARLDEFCKYSIRHWVRSNWIVHDLHAEMGRMLRCEWYREHALWSKNNDRYGLDQLSFAHVMARLEVERRTSMSDRCRPLEYGEIPMDGRYTDEEDWHLFVGNPDNANADADATIETDDRSVQWITKVAHSGSSPPPYVRILSSRTSIFERTLWKRQKMNSNTKKKKNAGREKERVKR